MRRLVNEAGPPTPLSSCQSQLPTGFFLQILPGMEESRLSQRAKSGPTNPSHCILTLVHPTQLKPCQTPFYPSNLPSSFLPQGLCTCCLLCQVPFFNSLHGWPLFILHVSDEMSLPRRQALPDCTLLRYLSYHCSHHSSLLY